MNLQSSGNFGYFTKIFRGKTRNGKCFWARGYAVSAVGFEEAKIKEYIRHKEQLDTKGADERGDF